MMAAHPASNWAAATEDGLVIDWDRRHDPDGQVLSRLLKDLGDIRTVTVDTPSDGKHWHFLRPPGPPIRSCKLYADTPAVDVKSSGGFVLIPWSQGQNGKFYRWGTGHKLSPCPAALIEHLTPILPVKPSKHLSNPPSGVPLFERCLRKWQSLKPVIDGERNTKLFSMAAWLRGEGADTNTIQTVLLDLNQEVLPPLSDRELSAIAASAAKYSPRLVGWS
jgi:hypothetical protein